MCHKTIVLIRKKIMKRQYRRFWWIDNGQQFVLFLIDAGTRQKRNHNYYRVTINTQSFFCSGFVANHSQITVSIFILFFTLQFCMSGLVCGNNEKIAEANTLMLSQCCWQCTNLIILFVVVVVVLYCSLICTCIRTKTNLLLGFPLKPYLMPESRF